MGKSGTVQVVDSPANLEAAGGGVGWLFIGLGDFCSGLPSRRSQLGPYLR
jgi:hypothetical protein